jgi:nucleoside phosphorylase
MARTTHPQRKEIARYLLSRGLDAIEQAPDRQRMAELAAPMQAPMARAVAAGFAFPEGLEPAPAPITPAPSTDAPLPHADVVVVTWTVDELVGLAKVFTPGVSPDRWHRYTHNFADFAPLIRKNAPAANSRRLGSYMPTRVGSVDVLCMKSELHLNQDGIGDPNHKGRATLPVKDLFKQIIAETGARLVLTVGTAGSVFTDFGLGDVVVTRAAKFRLRNEFRNEDFNGKAYRSDWALPTTHLDTAEKLMKTLAGELAEPGFGPPHPGFAFAGPLLTPAANDPDIKLELGGRDMPEFHPILTTDYFEYGTTTNHLDAEGAAVEMGDAALGLACSELDDPPHFAIVRNMSDPVINGDLPTKPFHLNEQTTWAVGYYTAYGVWTSAIGALATWGIVAGLS